MSKGVPHYSPEWLEGDRKRMAGMAPKPVATATPEARGELVPFAPGERVAVPVCPAHGEMTKTEERYQREVLHGAGRFEAVALKLPGGGRYTPDFMTIDDGRVTFHEVKGSYRLGSQGRAFTAFHEAAAYYPMWRFVWAQWTGKAWEAKSFEAKVELTGNQ